MVFSFFFEKFRFVSVADKSLEGDLRFFFSRWIRVLRRCPYHGVTQEIEMRSSNRNREENMYMCICDDE